jgi:hypothetical protein
MNTVETKQSITYQTFSHRWSAICKNVEQTERNCSVSLFPKLRPFLICQRSLYFSQGSLIISYIPLAYFIFFPHFRRICSKTKHFMLIPEPPSIWENDRTEKCDKTMTKEKHNTFIIPWGWLECAIWALLYLKLSYHFHFKMPTALRYL